MFLVWLIIIELSYILIWFARYSEETPRENWKKSDFIITIIFVAIMIASTIVIYLNPLVGILLLIGSLGLRFLICLIKFFF